MGPNGGNDGYGLSIGLVGSKWVLMGPNGGNDGLLVLKVLKQG